MVTSILVWRITWTEEPGGLQSMGLQKVRHDGVTNTSLQLQLLLLSHSVVSNSMQPHGLQPAMLLCPWDSPGKDTGMGCCALLQGIVTTQGSNLMSPALAGRFFTTSATWEAQNIKANNNKKLKLLSKQNRELLL